MKLYEGKREGYASLVTVNGRPLKPRRDLWNHSPTGFEWGYAGSGPAQLALALLSDWLADDEEAIRLHQEFKRAVVAGFPYRGWTLSGLELERIVENLRSDGRRYSPGSRAKSTSGLEESRL